MTSNPHNATDDPGVAIDEGLHFMVGRSELAAKRRLPSIYWLTEYAEAGGLMAYGPNQLDLKRRAAAYVDKLLKGAKPGDLPVEQPTKFELVINLRTAKAIGLTIPQRSCSARIRSLNDGPPALPADVAGRGARRAARRRGAQQADKMPRVGVLWPYTQAIASPFADAFREDLRGLGYVEGRTVLLEERWAEGALDRLPSLAAELVRLPRTNSSCARPRLRRKPWGLSFGLWRSWDG